MASLKGKKKPESLRQYQTVGTVKPFHDELGKPMVTFYCVGRECKLDSEQIETIVNYFKDK